jgi:hypothetical protein
VRIHTTTQKQFADKASVAREEDAMLDRMSQSSKAAACNDNGALPFVPRRAGPPKSVITIAGRVCETVLLSYVTKGAIIVSNPSGLVPVFAAYVQL